MTERKRNVIVGLTALAALAGLVLMLMLFGYLPIWMERGYRVEVELKSASGLSPGSRVRMDGLDIGRVVELRPEIAKSGPVVVVSTIIDSKSLIPLGARVRTEQPLLGGSPALAFDRTGLDPSAPDYVEMSKPLPTDGTARIVGEAHTPLTEFAQQLRSAMTGPSASFEKLAASFDTLSRDWSQVARNVNLLLEQRKTDEVDAGLSVGNLATVLARTDARLAELEQTLASINRWVGDEELRQNIRTAAAHAAELTATANKVAGKFGAATDKATELIDQTREGADRLVKRFIASADDLSAAIGSLKKGIDDAREGKGTVGRLMSDAQLYENLNDAAVRLNQAMVEFKLLIEKWKTEGLPVQF